METRFSAVRRILKLPDTEVAKDGRRFTIREMKLSDAEELLEHIKALAEERIFLLLEPDEIPKTVDEERNILRIYKEENRKMLVAVMDGKIVGSGDCRLGKLNKNRHTASFGVAVRKEYRNLGIGRALLSRLMDWAESKGAEKLWLSVFSTNESAMALYKKLGFEVECIRKGQFKVNGKYVDEVVMVKWLR